ncbi:polymerase delta-interacting protein 2 isoform X2 [Sitodiplosis mosellana]|uniref:polymerase delta-interacting protein 2 isoform X2 n=1 Tax=Sitodiplosis mosellana TaxID=263140 RepID=UPI0024449576|nr:polymerase delta-interacting protein 2 isoform X2 [Sitodiplosis mosellana]
MITLSGSKGLRQSRYLLINIISSAKCLSTQTVRNARLAEVGKLVVPKVHEKYETGQFFLHRVFGYRGVILFPWRAKIYDRNTYTTPYGDSTAEKTSPIANETDTLNKDTTSTAATASDEGVTKGDSTRNDGKKEVSVDIQTYYQVLIDSRDCPHVRAQTEAVTFLSNKDSNRNLYAIPGLDYVSHEDIIPYSVWNRDRKPLRHELFDKFLVHTGKNDVSFKASETLYAWQEKNHPWLELTEVHRETTENIRVTVIPFYMGSRQTPRTPVHWWRYSIRLENLGQLSVQLRERHWRIFALSGTLETVRGRGVVGQEPILNSRAPAFQYSSHISLQAPSGHMWGTFLMEREDGISFDCRIPPFSLDSTSNLDTNEYNE